MKRWHVHRNDGFLFECEAPIGKCLLEEEVHFHTKEEAIEFSQEVLGYLTQSYWDYCPSYGMNEELGYPAEYLGFVCEVRVRNEGCKTVYMHAILDDDSFFVTDLKSLKTGKIKISDIEDIEERGYTKELDRIMDMNFYGEEITDLKVIEDFLEANPTKLFYLTEEFDAAAETWGLVAGSDSELGLAIELTIDKDLNLLSGRYWVPNFIYSETSTEEEKALHEELPTRISRIESEIFNYSEATMGGWCLNSPKRDFRHIEVIGTPIVPTKLDLEVGRKIFTELSVFISSKNKGFVGFALDGHYKESVAAKFNLVNENAD